MATLTLPLRTDGYPHYDFDVELDGRIYNLEMKWNERDSTWFMTMSDSEESPIVSGVRLVVDWDLLRTCVDARRPPGTLMAVDSTGEGYPSLADLGSRVQLVYVEATA